MAEEGTGEQSDELGQEAASNLPSVQGDMSDIANLKHLIDDDIFQALKRHFQMSGKGRRPDLPKDLAVTKKLLLQLFLLKEEVQESFIVLKSWLEKLVPNTASITEGRLKHRVLHILATVKDMSDEDAQRYLDSVHDFHALAEPLEFCLFWTTSPSNTSRAVVWNPWDVKAKEMGDFDDEGYKEMICVEVGKVATPVTLPAGQQYECSQTFKSLL